MFKKKVALPTKKSMNLYQVDTSNDPKKTIAIIAIAAVLVVGLFVRFVVLEGITNINTLNSEIELLNVDYAQKQQKVQNYAQTKENYYRYSEKFAQAEEKLIDRITILELLDEATEDIASVTSTSISGNSINLKVVTSDLDDLANLRKVLEETEMVKDVVVYQASRSTGDVVSTISFKCEVKEAE